MFASFDITEKLVLKPEFHAYWLQNKNDSWYKSSGATMWNNTGGNSDSYVGSELSIVSGYTFNKTVKCEVGYSRFLSGDVAKKKAIKRTTSISYISKQ